MTYPITPELSPFSQRIASMGGWNMRCLPGGDALLEERDFAGLPLIESCIRQVSGYRNQGSGRAAYLGVGFIMEGHMAGPKGRAEAPVLQQNDIVIWHSHRNQAFMAQEHIKQQTLILPADAFGDALCFGEKRLGMRIAGDGWLGPMVSGLFKGLLQQIDRIPRSQHGEALNTTLNVLATALHANRERKNASKSDECFARLLCHIDHHLYDANLTPTSIARANRISLRQLHALFAGKGMKVACLIRERRLKHAMAMLQSQPAMSITDIAYKLGFQDSAHFSRLFRQRFDMSAQTFRRLHGEAGDQGAPLK